MFKAPKKIKASTLVISLLVVAVVLISELGIALTVLRQRRVSTGSNKSNQAFQTADKGVEEIMQVIINGRKTKVREIYPADCDPVTKLIDKDGYKVKFIDEDGAQINCDADSSIYAIEKLELVGFDAGGQYQQEIKTDLSAVVITEPPVPNPPPGPVFINPCGNMEPVNYAGMNYPIVPIGTQCWLGKNLNVGTMINSQFNPSDPAVIEKYCYNNQEPKCDERGGLYQWDEAMTTIDPNGMPVFGGESGQGICPAGWHIPTDVEWHTLETFLKEADSPCDPNRNNANLYDCIYAGDKLNPLDATKDPLISGITGFNAIRTAKKTILGGWTCLNYSLYWSSTSQWDAARSRELCRLHAGIARATHDHRCGLGVRCLKNGLGSTSP